MVAVFAQHKVNSTGDEDLCHSLTRRCLQNTGGSELRSKWEGVVVQWEIVLGIMGFTLSEAAPLMGEVSEEMVFAGASDKRGLRERQKGILQAKRWQGVWWIQWGIRPVCCGMTARPGKVVLRRITYVRRITCAAGGIPGHNKAGRVCGIQSTGWG